MATQRSSAVLLDGVKLPDGASPAGVPVVTYKDLFCRFILLGWIAFGGPTAHIALFQKVSCARHIVRPSKSLAGHAHQQTLVAASGSGCSVH